MANANNYYTKLIIVPLLLFLFSIRITNAQANEAMFALKEIGVKVNKPVNYYLLTKEGVRIFKDSVYASIYVCDEAKSSYNYAIQNPFFQVLLNKKSLNEFTIFMLMPKFKVGLDLVDSFQLMIIKQCYTPESCNLEYIGSKSGKCKLGQYVSLLNKVTNRNGVFYSEAFFIEMRSATLLVNFNTENLENKIPFIHSIDYLHDEDYENLLKEIDAANKNKNHNEIKLKISNYLSTHPQKSEAYKELAIMNLRLGNYDSAIKNADSMEKINKLDIDAYQIKGVAYFELGRYEDAIKYFEGARAFYNILEYFNGQNDYYIPFADMHRVIGETYFNMGNVDEGMKNMSIALSLTYDSLDLASMNFNIGYSYSKYMKDYAEAISYYSQALSYYPSYSTMEKSQAYFNRAINKTLFKDTLGAIFDYGQALKINPSYTKALVSRGILLRQKGSYVLAIKDFTSALTIDNFTSQLSSKALLERGIAKLLMGSDGCSDLKRATELGKPEYKKAYEIYCRP